MQVIYAECSAALNADYNDNERERAIVPFCVRCILLLRILILRIFRRFQQHPTRSFSGLLQER